MDMAAIVKQLMMVDPTIRLGTPLLGFFDSVKVKHFS